MAETGFLQALDDMIRITTNGLTFGGADRIAQALGEKDTAAKTAAARARAGIAGDGAEVLGFGGALKLGAKAIKAAPAISRAVLSKKGLGAAALGLGTLVGYNNRTAPAVAAQVAKPVARKGGDVYDPIPTLTPVATRQPTFAEMADQIAQAQGGKISLRQLGAAADVAQRTAVKPGKVPSAKDVAGQKYMDMVDVSFAEMQAAAQRKLAAGDPTGLDDGKAAAEWYRQEIGKVMGADPFADLMFNRDQEE
jgi:hypothetical protein